MSSPWIFQSGKVSSHFFFTVVVICIACSWSKLRRVVLSVAFLCLLVIAIPFRLVSSDEGTHEANENPAPQLAHSISDPPAASTMYQRFQNVDVQTAESSLDSITIEGTVFGPNGQPAANAIVLCRVTKMDLDAEITAVSCKTTTDATGRYSLKGTMLKKLQVDSHLLQALQIVAVDSQNRIGPAVLSRTSNKSFASHNVSLRTG